MSEAMSERTLSQSDDNPESPERKAIPLPRQKRSWPRIALASAQAGILGVVLVACGGNDESGLVPTREAPIVEPHRPVATQTAEGQPSVQTPITVRTPTAEQPSIQPSPTESVQPETPPTITSAPEPSPTAETPATHLLEFADGIDQQKQNYIRSAVDQLPPLGNTRIQITTRDIEGFWPNKDGILTLEVGVAGANWQIELFHGAGHALDPNLNPEFARTLTPEQKAQFDQAFETALADPVSGVNFAPDVMFSPAKDKASTHPELRGEVPDAQTINALFKIRADGAYIGRDSQFTIDGKINKVDFVVKLDPTLINEFVTPIPENQIGVETFTEFIEKNQDLLNRLSTSDPLWRIAIEDIKKYAPAFDNYKWAEAQTSLPRPFMLSDTQMARFLLTAGDLVLRYRRINHDQTLDTILTQEQKLQIDQDLAERIRQYKLELFGSTIGWITLVETPGAGQFESMGTPVNIPVEQMRQTLEGTPWYAVYKILKGTN